MSAQVTAGAGVAAFPWHWPGTRPGAAAHNRVGFYVALAGLTDISLARVPRASPWAMLFRPVAAQQVVHPQALKGRHTIALGNAQGNRATQPLKL